MEVNIQDLHSSLKNGSLVMHATIPFKHHRLRNACKLQSANACRVSAGRKRNELRVNVLQNLFPLLCDPQFFQDCLVGGSKSNEMEWFHLSVFHEEWNYSRFCLIGGMGWNGMVPLCVWLEGWDGINMVQVASCIEMARLPLAFANLHMYKFQQQLICIVGNIYSVFQKQ